MELTITCQESSTQVQASHVKRDSNTWADRLADGDYTGLNINNRRTIDITLDENWTIWHLLKDQND
jgi:hypothetical protein